MVDSEVATRLWQAANKLWANTGLRPSQFSQPILGLIFLRYAEEMYARAEDELGPVGTGRGAATKADYQAQGVIFLPNQARYSQLQALPEGFNIGQALNDAMKAIEDENEDLAGALPRAFTDIPNETLVELLRINAHTPSEFAFFAVELEVFRIGDSPAAPHYHVVAQPNEWTRHISARGKQIANTATTDTQETYRALWNALHEQLLEQWPGFRRRQALPQTWMSYPIGRAGFQLTTLASVRDQWAAVELYCPRDPAKVGLDQLLERKAAIEAAYGQGLKWDRMEDRKGWRVRVERKVDITDPSNWPDLVTWYRLQLEAFDRAFRIPVSEIDLDVDVNDPADEAP